MTKPILPVGVPFDLDPLGSWPRSRHVFDQASADAVLMAWAAERPLLVRGEPGTGKSQLARAVAQSLGRAFISEVVHARTEPQDLQWRFDSIARLGEAQALGARGAVANPQENSTDDQEDPLDPRRFLSPGPLWWAFDWGSAERNSARARGQNPASAPEGWVRDKGCVLLIDEIDKADSDVPNSMLETLGNRGFTVPLINEVVGQDPEIPPPLVIITTNEERELPAAFVRRCLVLHYELPADLSAWLIARGRVHFDEGACTDAVLASAADMLVSDREDARRAGMTPPGQAEYLDLLRAVTRLDASESAQLGLLSELRRYAYRKFAPPNRGS